MTKARQLPLLGMAMLAVGISLLAAKDGIGKILVTSGHYPVFLLWFQFATTWVVLAPVIVAREGLGALLPRPYGIQLVRGALIMGLMILFFVSLQYIQLAEAHAMVLIGPVLATALSPAFLGESVGWRRWVAVVCAFIGVLIILRPELTGAGTGYLIALLAGIGIGFYFVANRKAAGLASPLASVAHSVALGTFLLIPFLPFLGPQFHTGHTGSYFGFAALGILGQTLVILAFNYGEASLIAPFHYAVIVASVLFGYLVLEQLPDAITFLGIAIIVASGLYVAWREARIPRIDA